MHDAKRGSRGGVALATDGVVELRDARAGAGGRAARRDRQRTRWCWSTSRWSGPDGTVICTAEALVRWPHPEHGLIPPGDFLPVAQRSGLLRELDLWVLRTAHAGRPRAGPSTAAAARSVAVNLAGLLPGDPDFLPRVTDIVEASGLPWDRLVLELVETSLVALPPHALAAMAELVERGVRFAVDDFGTGYSSLARLKELPAQIVKVDRAFVTRRRRPTRPTSRWPARSSTWRRRWGASRVAEGVETADQFHVLRGIGVDAYQGWLFSPVAAAAAAARSCSRASG